SNASATSVVRFLEPARRPPLPFANGRPRTMSCSASALIDASITIYLRPIILEHDQPICKPWHLSICIYVHFFMLILYINSRVKPAYLRRMGLPEARLNRLPRMADFPLWAAACETALWPAGTGRHRDLSVAESATVGSRTLSLGTTEVVFLFCLDF